MNARYLWLVFVLIGALLLAGCDTDVRVSAVRSEAELVELAGDKSVRVEVEFGAGNLDLTGGAGKLLEADFTYNVEKLKPEVEYTDGTLIVWQPDTKGLPALQDLQDFRNEWNLRLNGEVPMDLRVNMGAGTNDLQLAGLSLTRLEISQGAGESTIDLSGDWAQDLDASIDTGAADITVLLPWDVGARVEVETGPTIVDASGLIQDGNVYTNAAYGASDVTLIIHMDAGIGRINLEVEEATAAID